jgi:rSAM/selenodomain-associated transferase 2
VLDEERRIGQRLTELSAMEGIGEVLVVDGGSSDGTVERARAFPGVRVLSAPRGRASQMNAGAERARGSVLLFLHADVRLPPEAFHHVTRALEDPGVVAGAFKTWTVDDVGRSRLGPLLHLADLRSRYTRLPYGDQALFVRAEAFRAAGGFPAQPLMEDLELSRRLWKLGRIRTVDARVTVSGRRFLARPLFYFLAVNGFPLLYRLGVSPASLLRLYAHVR